MIDALNKEQEDLMETVYKEYIQRNLSGENTYNLEYLVKFIDFLYKISDLEKPEIIICDSVHDMCIEANLKKGETIDYVGGVFDCGWISFYDYFQRIGVKYENEEEFNIVLNGINSGIFATVLYEKKAFCCIRPNEIHFNEENNLHKDLGMAIKWEDGNGFYFLNGVAVDEEIAMTESSKLDPNLIIKETNAQVRAEIIKKIGYSRIIRDLNAKKIDTWREYELYSINNIDVEPVILLKFSCPSTGTYYANRVPPNIDKAREAIKWCNHGIDSESFIKET